MPGCEQTLLAPELPADRCEGIGEGRVLLAIPSRNAGLQAHTVVEAHGEQRHDREQPKQARRGAGDRLVRPLALGRSMAASFMATWIGAAVDPPAFSSCDLLSPRKENGRWGPAFRPCGRIGSSIR